MPEELGLMFSASCAISGCVPLLDAEAIGRRGCPKEIWLEDGSCGEVMLDGSKEGLFRESMLQEGCLVR